MSRHRNVRTMNYDEYDDDDDYPYGHSVEDECISPTDAQQWIFDRARGQHSMSSFLANNRDIEEEDDDEVQAEQDAPNSSAKGLHHRRDSECYQLPELNDEDRVRLMSCMDEIRNIVGESLSDRQLVEAIMRHNYDFDTALDELLNSSKSTPQKSEAVVEKVVPKVLPQEPIEKDFKPPQLSSSVLSSQPLKSAVGLGPPRFNLPTVKFGLNAGANPSNTLKAGLNLSDLVKSRMKKDDTDSASSGSDVESSDRSQISLLPKLSDLSLNSDSGVASSSPAESTFSNLSDLARHHLQSKGDTPIGSPLASKSGGFAVPNIFKTPTLKPPPGFDPIAKPKPQLPLTRKDWIVDLKSALIKDKSEITAHRLTTTTSTQDANDDDEPISYGFIDCDIVESSKPLIDEFCLIDASGIMTRKLTNCTKTASGLGSILCLRYRKRTKLRVRHGFVSKPNQVVPFRFNVPSPDDVVLEHLNRFK